MFKKETHGITFKSGKIKPKINNLTEEELKYFNDVTLKNEFNNEIKKIPLKFKQDIKIFVHGDFDQDMIMEVKTVVSDLNKIIDPIELYFVQNRSNANMIIFFGKYDDFINRHVGVEPHWKIKNCNGFFLNTSNNKTGTIKSSVIFINLLNNESTLDIRETVREEITQGIGFYNDTWDYPNSCFYQGSNKVLKYPEIDVKLISHLYNE